MPGTSDATAPVSGGGPASAAGTAGGSVGGGSANASGAVPIGASMQTAAMLANRFFIWRWPSHRVVYGTSVESLDASHDFRDAEIGDDVVGVVGRTRQRRVRPDERLASACVEFDSQAGDLNPWNGALERLLVDRHDVHGAGLEVDLYLFGEVGRQRRDEAHGEPGREASRRDRFDVVREDSAADLVSGFERSTGELRAPA